MSYILKKDPIFIIFLSLFLSAYSAFTFASFQVTLVHIGIITGIAISLLISRKKLYLQNYMLFSILICILSLLSMIQVNSEYNSAFLTLFFYVTLIFTNRKISSSTFNKEISLFINAMRFFSIYGIYQFFGRYFSLPLSNLYISNFMVKGYNWTNLIRVGNIEFYRSNAIFLEPSIFSRLIVLALFLHIDEYLFIKKIDIRFYLSIIIFVLAFLLTFSGAGLFHIIFIGIFLLIKNRRKFAKRLDFTFKLIVPILLLSILILLVAPSTLTYFTDRLSEFGIAGKSASLRYVAPYELLIESLNHRPLFGFGIGSREFVSRNFGSNIVVTDGLDATIARIGIELGIIGILAYIFLLASLIRKRNFKISSYSILVIFIIIELLNGEMFLNFVYYIFLTWINIDVRNDKDEYITYN